MTAIELKRLAKMEAETRCSGAVYLGKLAALLGDEVPPLLFAPCCSKREREMKCERVGE